MDCKAMSTTNVSWFRKHLLSWYVTNKRELPWRPVDRFWLALVAEVLLTQTDANRVVPVFNEFKRRFPTAHSALAVHEHELVALIRPLGFSYRARTLRAAAQALIATRKPPQEEGDLLKLPGVGKYAASAIRSFYWGQRTPIVDINVVRILTRFFGLTPTTRLPERDPVLRQLIEALVPQRRHQDFNYALLDLGAAACRSKPKCGLCPLAQKCRYQHDGVMAVPRRVATQIAM